MFVESLTIFVVYYYFSYVFFSLKFHLQVVSGPGIYGWFEPIPQFTQWLKEMKTVFLEQDANVKCCFVQPAFVSVF